MANSIKIRDMVDGIDREVELKGYQIYPANLALQKVNDLCDVIGYLEDWFPEDYADCDEYDALIEKIEQNKDVIARAYRKRMDNDDTWFHTLRSVVKDYVDTIKWQEEQNSNEFAEYETYPPLTMDDGSENEKYDETIKKFKVPAEWAAKWIGNWSLESNISASMFKDYYTWDDTLSMYDSAVADNVIVSEEIVERG